MEASSFLHPSGVSAMTEFAPTDFIRGYIPAPRWGENAIIAR